MKKNVVWTLQEQWHKIHGLLSYWEKVYYRCLCIVKETRRPLGEIQAPWIDIPDGYTGWYFMVHHPIHKIFKEQGYPIRVRQKIKETGLYPCYWGVCVDSVDGKNKAEAKAKEISEFYKEFDTWIE